MSSGVKAIISQELKALEQGMFQEFCLSFLPIYNQKYQGLRRHGGTAEGKTRKGTPDLIKTNSDSTQIAVQCSVDKYYWKKTTNLADTKPCKDIIDCKDEVNDLVEIVLCSNQEIPTNNPNVYNEVINFAQDKTKAEITIISLPLIERELTDIPSKYENVFRMYLPDAYQCLNERGELFNKYELIHDSYKLLSHPLNRIEDIVNELKPEDIKGRKVLDVVLEKGTKLPSRYQRGKLPNDQTIKRKYGEEFIGGNIIGRVVSVLGVPKIGKSSLISQLCREFQEDGIEILWFESPSSTEEQTEFAIDIIRTLLGKLINTQVANEFAAKKLSVYELKEIMNSHASSGKYLLIIDDFNILSADASQVIENLIQVIKFSPLINSVGFILVSNKTLEILLSCLDGEFNSPKWDGEELKQFLEIKNISIPKPEEAYCSLLVIMSGGHPLIAQALTQKCSTLTDLLDTQGTGFPKLHHEELTKEVTQLLFDDLLSDHNLLQFVLRISILVTRHDISVLEFLSKRIDQPLQIPAKRMLEMLKGSVIEGDESTGYQVAFVFKNIAESYLSREEKKVIWSQLSDYLLSPEGNTLDVAKAIDGIHYSLMIPNYEKAFFFTLRITMYAYTKEKDETIIRIILSRLRIIGMLNFPPEDKQKLSYVYVLLVMAQTYNKINEYDEANTLLYRILDNKIVDKDEIDGFSQRNLYDFVSVFLILNLSRESKYDETLILVNKIDPKIIFSEELPDEFDFLDVVHYSLLKSQPINFPRKFFVNLLDIIDLTMNKKQFAHIIACFQRLAFQLSRQSTEDRNRMLDDMYQDSDSEIWKLLVNIVIAQMYSDLGEHHSCIVDVDKIITQSSEIITQSNVLESRLSAMKADSFYSDREKENAVVNYKRSISLLEVDPDDDLFIYSWCNYRLGLISSDVDVAFDAFNKAASNFEKQGFKELVSRSYGEQAVICYQKGNLTKTIEIIESLVETYYIKSVTEYAPSVTIGLALLTRLKYEREEERLPGKETEFPMFERGIFDRVKDFAKPIAVFPQALFLISEAYKSLGEKENQKRVLLRSFENKPRNKEEFDAKYLTLVRLMEISSNDSDIDGIKHKIVEFINDVNQTSEDDLINKTISQIFTYCDILAKNGSLDIHSYNSLILSIEDEIIKLNDKKKGYILAEIYKRMAGINDVTPKNNYDKAFVKKAWEYASISNNYGVLLDTGHLLGFEFFTDLTSIREMTEIQLSVLLACCLKQSVGYDTKGGLKIIGENLFKLWSAINYKKATESEYLYIINLKYRAENLRNNNIPEELCSPIMILCLIKVFNVSEIDDYKDALEWAKSKIAERKDEIPREEREYLKEFIES